MKRNSGNSGDNQQGEVVAVDLGLKLQNQDRPFECHQNGRRSSGGDDDDNNNNGGDGGPTCNEYTTMSDTYNVVTTASVANHHLFKPLGGMATEEIGFPFTISQWKELERQAMIYKYMVSSLPVPHDLLYSSFSSSLSATPTFSPASYFLGRCGNGWNYRWVGNGNNKDAEPGRCRRTDGKKWRCSRDVAPNQKYCERHMHRGRPRSRKPVELVLHRQHSLSDFTVNKNINSSFAINTSSTKKTRLDGPDPRSVGSSFPCVSGSKGSTFDHPLVSGVSPFEDSRNLVSSEEQQWQQMVQTNMSTQLFQHQLEGESLNLNSHVGFNTKSDMTLLERPLIDAWPMVATGNKDNCGSNKVSFSSPNGGHGNAIDEDMCQIHMGLRVSDSWVDSSASLGGPLAEVLRPGSVAASTSRSASNLGSSDAGEGDFVTPPATAVSSPSGVLHKTLASHSDSSGSSSPTCPRSKAKSDMPFNWLN